jgi:hypothetical protein
MSHRRRKMRRAIVAALSGSVFALGIATVPLPAFAQSSPAPMTCRPALEGLDFVQVRENHQLECCYVAWEEPWYNENDVLLHRVYLRTNDDKVLTSQCSPALTEALAAALGTANEASSVNGAPSLNGGNVASGGNLGGAGNGNGGAGNGGVGNDPDNTDEDVTDPDEDTDDDDNGNAGGNGNGNGGSTGNGHGKGGQQVGANPGNIKTVGGAGEEPPHGSGDGFNFGPGLKGKSD